MKHGRIKTTASSPPRTWRYFSMTGSHWPTDHASPFLHDLPFQQKVLWANGAL